MSVEAIQNDEQALPSPAEHVIGFVVSQVECDAVTSAMTKVGVPITQIKVLHGQNGIELFDQMMDGALWGEDAERVMKMGEEVLRSEQFVFIVNAKDRDEGLRIAKAAESHGGHGFTHFGSLADERLTR